MNWTMIITLLIILFIIIIFGSLRQYRIKKIISIYPFSGGGRGCRHRGAMFRRNRWPGWLSTDYWWPQYDCVDYATQQCTGAIDYQSCFNREVEKCQY